VRSPFHDGIHAARFRTRVSLIFLVIAVCLAVYSDGSAVSVGTGTTVGMSSPHDASPKQIIKVHLEVFIILLLLVVYVIKTRV
jgi:hypothetical protein